MSERLFYLDKITHLQFALKEQFFVYILHLNEWNIICWSYCNIWVHCATFNSKSWEQITIYVINMSIKCQVIPYKNYQRVIRRTIIKDEIWILFQFTCIFPRIILNLHLWHFDLPVPKYFTSRLPWTNMQCKCYFSYILNVYLVWKDRHVYIT